MTDNIKLIFILIVLFALKLTMFNVPKWKPYKEPRLTTAEELLRSSIDIPDTVSIAELTEDEMEQRRSKRFGEYCASCKRLHVEFYKRKDGVLNDPNL